jgi:ABC-type branched-subunit amino acid transport system ATPase component
MPEEALIIKNLIKRFGAIAALEDVWLSLRKGSITSLIGPNGAGKTTLFNIIGGFVRPDGGNVYYRGKNITNLSPSEIVRRGIACLMQDNLILPGMTALENVMIGFPDQAGESFLNAVLAWPKVNREEYRFESESRSLLETYGLSDKQHQISADLSYGEKKRVGIARLCATNANLLLLDEPTTGLDPVATGEIGAAILELKKQGKTLFIIEHNQHFVTAISDYIYIMDRGRVCEYESSKEIQAQSEFATRSFDL